MENSGGYIEPEWQEKAPPGVCRLNRPVFRDIMMAGGDKMSDRKIKLAEALAAYAHEGQVDKAGVDYIKHPEAVSAKLEDEVGKIVALLHDVLEDTAIKKSTLRDLFGDEIADTVVVLTHRKGESYEHYIHRIGKNRLATRVKLADLCHNMDESRLPVISREDEERREKYRRSREYLEKILTDEENGRGR